MEMPENQLCPHQCTAADNDYEELLEKNGESLKERYEREEKQIVKVEHSSIRFMLNVWNSILTVFALFFAASGLLSLLSPSLRLCLVRLFQQFFRELGIL